MACNFLAASDSPAGDTSPTFCPNHDDCYVSPHHLPERGWTLGPWVKVCFLRSDFEITVGNESCPQNGHNACIKSFEFGQADGLTCKITIQDQQGSDFVYFMQNLMMDFKKLVSTQALTVKAQWGWVKSGCIEPIPPAASPVHVMLLDSVETDFAQGKFTFEITAKDLPYKMGEARAEKWYGTEAQPMTLKDALTAMLTDPDEKPAVSNVKFLRLVHQAPEVCNFKFWPKGPEHSWRTRGMDKITCARAWIKSFMTDQDKGWTMAYDDVEGADTIIFWEDPKPICNKAKDWKSPSIGTYIVNGGKKSPVIEFNPRLRWDFGSLINSGGTMGNSIVMPKPNDDDGKGHTTGDEDCDFKRILDVTHSAGIGAHDTEDDVTKDVYPIGHQQEYKEKALAKDARANRLIAQPIQADLVIVGDPTLVPPAQGILVRNCSIVFINPYYITGRQANGCGEWLASQICNEILTNKAWLINRITHKISPGHYTTTLGVYLAAPGLDVNTYDPLGGKGSCGWVPMSGPDATQGGWPIGGGPINPGPLPA